MTPEQEEQFDWMLSLEGCPSCGCHTPGCYVRFHDQVLKDGSCWRREVAYGCDIHGDYLSILNGPTYQVRPPGWARPFPVK